jgi:hypothetical protein
MSVGVIPYSPISFAQISPLLPWIYAPPMLGGGRYPLTQKRRDDAGQHIAGTAFRHTRLPDVFISYLPSGDTITVLALSAAKRLVVRRKPFGFIQPFMVAYFPAEQALKLTHGAV